VILPDEKSPFSIKNLQSEQFIVVYRRTGEEIIIEESNDTFAKIFGNGEKMRGKSVSEYPLLRNVSDIFRGLGRYQMGREINYLYEIGGAYWSVVAKADGPLLVVTGKRLDLPRFDQIPEILSLDFLRSTLSFTVLVEIREYQYLIHSFSREAAEYLELHEGQRVRSAIENRLSRIKDLEMLLDHIGKVGIVRLLEEVHFKQGPKKCLISILPIEHMQFAGIYILIHILDEQQFYQLHKTGNFLEEYYINSDVGIAIFEYDQQKVIRSNTLFEQVAGGGDGTNLKKIVTSGALQKARKTQLATFEEMAFRGNGMGQSYILSYIPVLGESKTMILLSRKNKVGQPLKELSSSLSEREREIVDMVIRGSKNAQIAKSLGIAEGTVKKTLHNVYGKLQVDSRVELIKRIYR